MKYLSIFFFALILFRYSAAVVAEEPSGSRPSFVSDVLPILQSHCIRCHGSNEQSGDLRIDTLSTDLIGNRAAAETWHRIMKMIESAEMPPEDAKPLPPQKRERLLKSLSGGVNQAIRALSDRVDPSVPRRLNRVEYANTMRGMLGLDMDYTRDLPADSLSKDGFRNNGQSLQMSAEQLGYYLDTARRAMERIIVSDPAPKVYEYHFAESNVTGWKGKVEFSNRLGRTQEFIVKMVDDYPESGEFLIRVQFSAELKPNRGFPLMEVALGYRPDTEILFRQVALVEVEEEAEQILEFRGRLEEYPLPVRGQGKFPGLVVKIRNAYDDGSEYPQGEQNKEKNKRWEYPDEPDLPKLMIHSVYFSGPVFDEWPPSLHRRLLFDSKLRHRDEQAYVAKVLERFMRQAYRRPVKQMEVDRMVEFFSTVRHDFPTFEEAIRETFSMVLISPEFLYLMEPASNRRQPVNDWELASRLSYFLWSTMPDQELRSLAKENRLHEPAILLQQVDRLLNDAKLTRFIEQFTDQWLQLDKLNYIAVNREKYPDFDDALKEDLRSETRHFVSEIVQHDLSALNLLQSDFLVINERLARLYGIEGVFGNRFRRIAIEPNLHRGGLLGQASILLGNSTGRESHPVRRAVWIRDRLLNDPPAPPPPDVPPLNEADPAFLHMSIRQQLEVHRQTESCAQCHRDLDPWGVALENFDALGLWREEIELRSEAAVPSTEGDESASDTTRQDEILETQPKKRIPVDALAVFSDGLKINGVEQLKEHLVRRKSILFARSLVIRILSYALGRSLDLGDEPMIDELTKQFVSDDYRVKSLIKNIVLTNAFLTK